jgi:hypothetical protein
MTSSPNNDATRDNQDLCPEGASTMGPPLESKNEVKILADAGKPTEIESFSGSGSGFFFFERRT